MAIIGTFGSFTAARLGIYASQASLNVTGNNIANINTGGYTRQRMDLVSLYSYSTVRYVNSYQQNIGYGVLTKSVSQLRDPFLDIRYREENASTGAYDAKLNCLEQLAQVLDEVGKGTDDFGIVAAQFEDFLGQLNNFHLRVGSVEYDTTVRGSAQTLAQLFNDYSKAMDTIAANKLGELKENVKTVNALLTQIRDLSAQIREAGIVGDNALELRDARNLCIDELSAYMKINVTYDEEKIDEWNSVERINISIANSGTPPIMLIRGIYGAQISMPETTYMRNPDYDANIAGSKRYAYMDENGKLVPTNLVRNPDYDEEAAKDPNYKISPYLRLKPDGTYEAVGEDGLEAGEKPADMVNNAVTGADDNHLWMTVEPLVDAKGVYMRNDKHQEVRASVDLSDTQLYGSLQSIREFLTEKGEFSNSYDIALDKNATKKRGLPYYQHALDALAKKFAEAFNNANRLDFKDVLAAYQYDKTTDKFLDSNGLEIELETMDTTQDPAVRVTPSFFEALTNNMTELEDLKKKVANKELTGQDLEDALTKIDSLKEDIEASTEIAYDAMEELRTKGQLTDLWSFYNGGVLFSSNGDTNDTTGITAGNITLSNGWSTGEVRLLNTKLADGLDHSSSNDNILHMIALMSQDMDYLPNEVVNDSASGDKRYFTGSFAERLADMNSILSVETNTTILLYNSYTATTLSLENGRQSVAGVDLNDEATNMMVFQKAYAAACQLMTTLDSMLDKLINGTLR